VKPGKNNAFTVVSKWKIIKKIGNLWENGGLSHENLVV
jgi:hypothetical protein